jgi:hypothetical protein
LIKSKEIKEPKKCKIAEASVKILLKYSSGSGNTVKSYSL